MLLASSGWRSQGRPAQASRSRNRDPIDRSAHLTWERGGEVWQRALPGPRRDPGTGSPSFLTLLGRSRSRQRDVVLGIPEMIASSSPARTACLNRNGGFAPRRGTPPVPPAARSSNRQSELRCPLGIPRAPAHPGSIRNLSRGRPTPSATSPLTSARRCEPSRPLASATRALRGDGRRRGRRRVRRPPGRPSADGDAARHRISATAPHRFLPANAAGRNRPPGWCGPTSGVDGSPPLHTLELEYGGRDRPRGRQLSTARSSSASCRHHGGAFGLSGALTDNVEVIAVEGAYAPVIGGTPSAAIVFARAISARTDADARRSVRGGLDGAGRESAAGCGSRWPTRTECVRTSSARLRPSSPASASSSGPAVSV
jgi:hypothetical protein